MIHHAEMYLTRRRASWFPSRIVLLTSIVWYIGSPQEIDRLRFHTDQAPVSIVPRKQVNWILVGGVIFSLNWFVGYPSLLVIPTT